MVGFEPTQLKSNGFTDRPSSPTLAHTLLEVTLEFIKSPQVTSRQSVQAESGDSNPNYHIDSVACKPLHYTLIIAYGAGFEPAMGFLTID